MACSTALVRFLVACHWATCSGSGVAPGSSFSAGTGTRWPGTAGGGVPSKAGTVVVTAPLMRL